MDSFGIDFLEPRNISDRIYNKWGFTHWEDGWIYGVWYCGTSFQKAIYHGQYPMTFVKRIRTGFPLPARMLHLCSGRCHIDGAVNVDIMPLPESDVQADGEQLPFANDSFDVCLIDPPYAQEDATRYGVKRLIRPKKTMEEVYRVLGDGGWLLWLDEKYPQRVRKNWDLIGLIGIITGANRRARVLSMFRSVRSKGESLGPLFDIPNTGE